MSVLRLFLDTNVLIDFYAQRKPFDKDAQRFLIMSEFGDAELWASAKSYTDIFYVLNKTNDSNDIQLAFKNSFEWFNLCSVTPEDVHNATEQSWDDFEDCLIAQGVNRVKADYLISRDKTGFTHCNVPVLSSDEFFLQMEQERNLVYDIVDW